MGWFKRHYRAVAAAAGAGLGILCPLLAAEQIPVCTAFATVLHALSSSP